MKKIFFILIFNLFVCILMGQEILLKAIEDAYLWSFSQSSPRTFENSVGIVKKDEIVSAGGSGYYETTVNGIMSRNTIIFYNGTKYGIQIDKFIPINSIDMFNNLWLTTFTNRDETFWINADYLGILPLGKRDAFKNIEGVWIDSYNKRKDMDMYMLETWYEFANVQTQLDITKVTLYAGGFSMRWLWIINIIPIKNGYRVTVVDDFFESFAISIDHLWNKIQFPNDRRSYNLLLIKDKDYLDMYLDSQDKRLATFVKVDKIIVDELNNILKNNNADISKITFWPRRADGSMDYPPPGVDLSRTNDEIISDNKIADNIVSQQNVMTQDNGEKSSLPLPLLLAIIGGVVIAVGVVVVVLRKKK